MFGMFKSCTKDVSFAAMLYKGAPPLWLIMHQRFHSYTQMAPRCSQADRIPGRILRPWGGCVIV